MIYQFSFRVGPSHAHENCLDRFNPGRKVGRGVYFCPEIKIAEAYAGFANLGGKKFKVVLMNRVKNNKIRSCGNCQSFENYYIVNGTTDEVRPYRILLKNMN